MEFNHFPPEAVVRCTGCHGLVTTLSLSWFAHQMAHIACRHAAFRRLAGKDDAVQCEGCLHAVQLDKPADSWHPQCRARAKALVECAAATQENVVVHEVGVHRPMSQETTTSSSNQQQSQQQLPPSSFTFVTPTPPKPPVVKPSQPPRSDSLKAYCDICNVTIRGNAKENVANNYRQHLRSNAHKEKMRLVKTNAPPITSSALTRPSVHVGPRPAVVPIAADLVPKMNYLRPPSSDDVVAPSSSSFSAGVVAQPAPAATTSYISPSHVIPPVIATSNPLPLSPSSPASPHHQTLVQQHIPVVPSSPNDASRLVPVMSYLRPPPSVTATQPREIVPGVSSMMTTSPISPVSPSHGSTSNSNGFMKSLPGIFSAADGERAAPIGQNKSGKQSSSTSSRQASYQPPIAHSPPHIMPPHSASPYSVPPVVTVSGAPPYVPALPFVPIVTRYIQPPSSVITAAAASQPLLQHPIPPSGNAVVVNREADRNRKRSRSPCEAAKDNDVATRNKLSTLQLESTASAFINLRSAPEAKVSQEMIVASGKQQRALDKWLTAWNSAKSVAGMEKLVDPLLTLRDEVDAGSSDEDLGFCVHRGCVTMLIELGSLEPLAASMPVGEGRKTEDKEQGAKDNDELADVDFVYNRWPWPQRKQCEDYDMPFYTLYVSIWLVYQALNERSELVDSLLCSVSETTWNELHATGVIALCQFVCERDVVGVREVCASLWNNTERNHWYDHNALIRGENLTLIPKLVAAQWKAQIPHLLLELMMPFMGRVRFSLLSAVVWPLLEDLSHLDTPTLQYLSKGSLSDVLGVDVGQSQGNDHSISCSDLCTRLKTIIRAPKASHK